MHTLVSPILARHKWFNLNQAIEPVLSFKALWATPKQKKWQDANKQTREGQEAMQTS